jgi:bisphosphoglycerate-dependent phosphoglycerate mutase
MVELVMELEPSRRSLDLATRTRGEPKQYGRHSTNTKKQYGRRSTTTWEKYGRHSTTTKTTIWEQYGRQSTTITRRHLGHPSKPTISHSLETRSRRVFLTDFLHDARVEYVHRDRDRAAG